MAKRSHGLFSQVIVLLYHLVFIEVFTRAQTLDQPRGPWRLAFKIVHGKVADGFTSFNSLYTSSSSYNANSVAAQQQFDRNSEPFKSDMLEAWETGDLNVQAVKMVFFKNSEAKQYIVFNGVKRTKADVFDCDNILYSSYTDLPDPDLPSVCPGSSDRFPFSVQKVSSDQMPCDQTRGWTVVADNTLQFAYCTEFQPYENVDKPYFKYAVGSSMVDLSTGLEDADSIGIFLQVWDLVFKGVSGVSLTASVTTLADLWRSSDHTMNEGVTSQKKLTKTLSSVQYKSSVVNNWDTYHIDMIKLSMIKSGNEEAFVIFDGVKRNSTAWFSGQAILQSSYTDTSTAKQICSIEGDEYRDWQIQERGDTSGCTTTEQHGWMLVREQASEAGPCTWDNYDTLGRPYFLYSTATGAEFPGGSSYDHADLMAVFVHGWRLVLKVSSGGSLGQASSLYDLWANTYTLNVDTEGATSLTTGTPTFKSDIVDQWSDYYVRAVKVALYNGGQEVMYIVFDAAGTTKRNWFRCNSVLHSSVTGIPEAGFDFCTIYGDQETSRRFFMGNPQSCDLSSGVMAVLDTNDPDVTCQRTGNLPRFTYSMSVTGSLSLDVEGSNALSADVFAIFLDVDPNCSTVCQNGATCEEQAGDFRCYCINDFYGKTCSDFDGAYSDWVLTTPCSVTCGGGVEVYTRACDNPPAQGNGKCHGDSERVDSCNTQPCPIDGGYSDWNQWTTCSKSCETGSRSRSRECTNPVPEHGGADCVGEPSVAEVCNTQFCPIDGSWSAWSDWSVCTVTCAGGSQSRSRSCDSPSPQYDGADCDGTAEETMSCNSVTCPPVDGGFSNWSQWTECTETCGTGSRSRSRECNNPIPALGGADCDGSISETEDCNTDGCSIDGGWSIWSSWNACTSTCGIETGSHDRTRACSNPAPAGGGITCDGSDTDTKYCNNFLCPIDGGWGSWSAWSSCSVTCGLGFRYINRTCSNPAPRYGGETCTGNTSDAEVCNTPCTESLMQCDPESPGDCEMFFKNGGRSNTHSRKTLLHFLMVIIIAGCAVS